MLNIVYIFIYTHPSTTKIHTLSLHDALPISARRISTRSVSLTPRSRRRSASSYASSSRSRTSNSGDGGSRDRKSTRLNSSHVKISYAVFCLKKKKKLIDSLTYYNKFLPNIYF